MNYYARILDFCQYWACSETWLVSSQVLQKGLSEKLVASRTAFVFSRFSAKNCENTIIRKVSEEVFHTFRTPPFAIF
jgi:hypothetical protein